MWISSRELGVGKQRERAQRAGEKMAKQNKTKKIAWTDEKLPLGQRKRNHRSSKLSRDYQDYFGKMNKYKAELDTLME